MRETLAFNGLNIWRSPRFIFHYSFELLCPMPIIFNALVPEVFSPILIFEKVALKLFHSEHLRSLKKESTTTKRVLGNFHGEYISRISCALDNSAKINSRKKLLGTLNS